MTKPVEYPVRKDENGNFMKLRKVYDNGGKTVDRYTVTFEIYNDHTGKWEVFSEGTNTSAPEEDSSYDKIYCLSMSAKPFHPQGFGQSGTCFEGRHLGKRIRFSQLPEDVKRCIVQYLET